NQDASLWPAEEHDTESIKNNLRWLELPRQMPAVIAHISQRAAILKDGIDHIVFVGMDGSNLAAATILKISATDLDKKIHLLDTTDPNALRELESLLIVERTVFVFTEKSGTRIETHALLLYFLHKLKSSGTPVPGRHFVAITEADSYLANLGKEYKFRDVFFDPPGIHSRFSGLIHFVFMLSAICNVNELEIMENIKAMTEACSSADMLANPAAVLAAFLAAGEVHGLHRLIILSPEELTYFAHRIAQLVGASTAGEKRGFIPIFGQPLSSLKLTKNCLVINLKMKNRPSNMPDEAPQFAALEIPVVEIELDRATDFSGEIFKWEIATVLACAALQLNPFRDVHDPGSSRIPAARLENIVRKREAFLPTERVKENGISLYVETSTRREISTLSLRAALRTFLELRNPDGYIAILPFFGARNHLASLQTIRDRIGHALAIPVQIVSGPGYLRTLGTVYKCGPAHGIFILLTADPEEDIPIPGAGYAFGDLQLALAQQELEELRNSDRCVIRLHFYQGAGKGLQQFSDIMDHALMHVRGHAG
ncbi:MAG: hypothetical protein M3N22_02945, partial [Acidobacteriota bacterium]|nr:hypothetical protein [Acidobacteriota bacterium]